MYRQVTLGARYADGSTYWMADANEGLEVSNRTHARPIDIRTALALAHYMKDKERTSGVGPSPVFYTADDDEIGLRELQDRLVEGGADHV